jgi:Calx-beta domain/FG-GAP-like repeat/Bacterial Ig-like domain
MLFHSFRRHLDSHGPCTRGKCSRRRAARARLFIEPLENRALPSFITAPSYPVGLGPSYSMAAGDFNGDGAPDFVTADRSSYTVSLLLSNGDGTFQPAVTFDDIGYTSVAAGDFDSNGTLDLAVGDNGVNVLLGNGDGTFQTAVNYAAGSFPFSMAVADFNSDGAPDLAMAGSGKVSILLGTGDGSFQAPIIYDAGSAGFSVAAADFNGDGALDLALADSSLNNVRVWRGIGDGTFQPVGSYAVGSQPRSVAVGEFNGDGVLDLAVANRDSDNVSVLLGRGDGTFQPRVNYAAGSGTQAVTIGDWNGDGNSDFASTSSDTNSVSIMLGRGDGTFLAGGTFVIGSLPVAIVSGDWDGDGHLDLAVADSAFSGGGSPAVSVLLGNGDGTFVAARSYVAGNHPRDVAVGDFNEDGAPDIAVANYHSDYVSVFLGLGDGTFETAVNYAIGTSASSVAVADFDGDGHQDLAVAGDRLDVLLGNGDGTFRPTTFYGIGLSASSVAAADFNGDGALDIAASQTNGGVVILIGNGDGTFQAAHGYYAGPGPYSLAAGDFNHDDRIDLVVTNFENGGTPYKVYVLLGNGDGSFQDPVPYGLGNDGRSVTVDDFNADGDLDLAVASLTSNTVTVFLGNGDGTFPDGTDYPTGQGPRSVAVGDFNRDGIPDLVLATGEGFFYTSDTVRVLLGRGDGTFLAAANYTGGMDPRSVAVGDFNGDGFNDLALANWSANAATVLLNEGIPTSVSINQAVGQADPTNGSTITFTVHFSSPVTGFDGTDIDFNGSTVGGGLVADVTGSDADYAVTVTGMTGEGIVVARIPAGAATDLFGTDSQASTSTDNTVTFDGVAPAVTIDQAAGQADPTTFGPITFTVHFSEVVTGFDGSDVSFAGSTVGGTLVASVTGSGADYTVTVTGMTGQGTVVASIPAGAATDAIGNGSSASTSTDNSVTFVPPTVTIDQGATQLDPTNSSSITFDVHFSEAVTGFDGSDILFTGSTVGGALVAVVSGVSPGQDYTVTVTGMIGTGTVVASIKAGAAVNDGGTANAASTSTDNTVAFDGILPSVTINQAVGQSDPTNVASIKFDVKFSEVVTGFDASDVSLAGSTAGGTLAVNVAGSGDTYVVTITGMTSRGFVVSSIPAGAATDVVGNLSLASTSTDNSVEFANTGVLAFSQAVYSTAEMNGTLAITVTRTGDTEGAVSIQYSTNPGTAHAGTDYTTKTGTLSWADGEGGSKTFDVTLLDDSLNEGKEIFNLALTNPVGSPGLGLTTATVAIAPSDGQGPGKYLDQDGDKVTIKLNGKTGSLLWFRTDPDGDGKGPIELIELTDTLPDPLKPKAVLAITVTKGSKFNDGTVNLGAITGPGLKTINARKANLNLEGIDLNGYLGSLVIGNISNGADIATLATSNPKQKTSINALAIGDGTVIDVGANVSSLTATSFGAGSFKAPSVGTMTIKGAMSADVNITGVGVDPTKKALTKLKVTGAVTGSDIFVTGNVGTVSVGAFRDSRLFAGYTGADDGTGTFNFAATVTTFKVTGNFDGFQNSRVIATNFKTVTIKNLDSTNSASKFGFYAHASLGVINVVGPTKFKYNAALPTPQGIGDFEVKLV